MQAKIFSHEHLIGIAELQVGDEAAGHVFGCFMPTEFYFDNVRKFVWDFNRTPDYKKWQLLRINAQLANGVFVFPQGGYTIDDIQEMPDEPKQIDLVGVCWEIVQDFIVSKPPKPFVEGPWSELQIEQKNAFEYELAAELGINKRLSSQVVSLAGQHVLADSEFSAFCRDTRNDDVLFEIHKNGLDKKFALVHLTWASRKEQENYPITTLYTDFNEFKYLRMDADKADWEC